MPRVKRILKRARETRKYDHGSKDLRITSGWSKCSIFYKMSDFLTMPLLHWPSWSKDELIYGWYIAPVTSFAVGIELNESSE
mmetsp:Transcript_23927/g.58481  ORF Transcript_23927/g.58481 Transcript_23927/m.58481 type:complete len:82 (+) Transcript_23927:1330-1575(+)